MNSQEYLDWLKKFEVKKTTDDCYTPPKIYDIVKNYVHENFISLDGLQVKRPFYPDGDYQAEAAGYDDKVIVIDNPPFSKISEICQFYEQNNIKFFIFAPALTVFNALANTQTVTAIISPSKVVYDNGAIVNTAFLTNLTPQLRVKVCPDLHRQIEQLFLAEKNTKSSPKYQYPDHVLSAAMLNQLCKSGIDFEIKRNECYFIRRLDNQKRLKKQIFGAGFLISDAKAKELKEKELQAKNSDEKIKWVLSHRERRIIDGLI